MKVVFPTYPIKRSLKSFHLHHKKKGLIRNQLILVSGVLRRPIKQYHNSINDYDYFSMATYVIPPVLVSQLNAQNSQVCRKKLYKFLKVKHQKIFLNFFLRNYGHAIIIIKKKSKIAAEKL